MASSSAERPGYSTAVTFSSSLLQWSLASIVPGLLMVLLLLLCIPFKRKNRCFSTNSIKRETDASRLMRVTQLEDQSASSSEGEHPSAGRTVQEGGSLQTNGFTGNSHPQPGGSSLPKDLGSSPPNHRENRESRAPGLGSLGTSLPAASRQNPTAPESVQFWELPEAPGDTQVTTTEQLGSRQGADGPVYESIRDRGITGSQGHLSELSVGAGACPNVQAGCAAARGEVREPGETWLPYNSKPEQRVADPSSGDPWESPQGWQEIALEEDVVNESLSEREKQLRAMYARVCKKSRPSGQSKPASLGASQEPEEEEPPPLPEKHIDVIYESLCLGSETQQDGEVLTVKAQPEDCGTST